MKTILIVGASSGIGKAAAKMLVARGHNVVNMSRGKCAAKKVVNITLDVASNLSIAEAVRLFKEKHGKIDALVYCAGISIAAPVEVTKQEDYTNLFDVNLFGFAKIVQHILPMMRKQEHGKIIAVGSLAGLAPIAFNPFYNASKAALLALVKSLDMELGEFDALHASIILPGGVATGFSEKRKVYPSSKVKDYKEQMEKAVEAITEIEQGGSSPEDVAKEIVDIIKAKNPPVVRIVGKANKAQVMASNILPERLVNVLNKRKYS